MRKTVKIVDLINQVNRMLEQSTCKPDVRQGMIVLLQGVLHDAGCYKGFMYLNQADVPHGEKPGIRYDKDETGKLVANFDNTDDSRRMYYS